ncbi:uncharacterized protein F4812DRAFT_110578 [Daldinia caldariorum]|uniref:uncharacterized protein n=1 Tax=Daldinia caldariorum TaxID=326644 RepID=UPI00200817BC|nr:uncharacterized protein F4812DRAFT_110578 [Daldinia caldariorum]KAI1465752.1 hypothetical protein F4812DRAFT_110578 [Daldinia caldariorum]
MASAKVSLPIMEEKPPMRNRCRRQRRPILAITLIAASFCAFYTVFFNHALSAYAGMFVPGTSRPEAPTCSSTTTDSELIPLEAHIMSKCPDARDCLRDLVLPAMMRINDKVNFTLSYIGTPTENDGVDCKHGPAECLGNIIELCARNLYPDPKIHLGFTMCLTKDYKMIPQRELVEDCALEHAIDFEKLNDCAARDDGAIGMAMLRESVQRSADVRSNVALLEILYWLTGKSI